VQNLRTLDITGFVVISVYHISSGFALLLYKVFHFSIGGIACASTAVSVLDGDFGVTQNTPVH